MAVLRDDPYSAVNFVVVINGILDDGHAVRGSFAEVSGLGAEIAVVEYRNGSEQTTTRKLPGLTKFPNIVLKRGQMGDLTLWTWMQSAMEGRVVRADGTITLLDESRQPVLVWKFRRGWPCKWTGAALNARGSDVAIETLEICHEGLQIE